MCSLWWRWGYSGGGRPVDASSVALPGRCAWPDLHVSQRCLRQEKYPEKSSAGPDFLGFLSKIDIILKKNMFFDKKYILFLLCYVYNIRENILNNPYASTKHEKTSSNRNRRNRRQTKRERTERNRTEQTRRIRQS